ncbi:heparinase II/III domain-containing protein [Streptococcus catagoni]|uniref:heparinase II/III domain-containing protein n=1 Tax=Streptococcus catagoni TaxID=2654874 RepID=UPI00140BE543|nr:heparinase II/III family protein [Streptococcus catagoni]
MGKIREERIREFFVHFDDDFCRDYILKNEKETYLKLKETVDMMMEHTFVFNDNWDMEPSFIPHHLDKLDWDKQATDDPEWNFMLNRQTYLFKFLVLYLLEKDSKYLAKIKYFINDWIDKHPVLEVNSLYSRTLDTGIRTFTWLKILLYLRHFKAITVEEEDKILAAIRRQFLFLYQNYLDKYSLSNWGILQTTAMLATFYYYEDKLDFPEIKAFAQAELIQQLRLQILEDGTQYEQSIMYHVQVYKALLELAIFAPEYRELLEDTLKKMAAYISLMTGPDHCQIALGDSDVSDTRDILTLSAIYFRSSSLKAKSFKNLDIESLMYFGKKGSEIFESLPVNRIEKESYHFDSSGHVCCHDDRRFLFFKCGSLGSAHSHSDQNSICLYDKGEPIFIDPGRYTYKEENYRYLLKSSKSHSTCFLRDFALEEIKDSWQYERYPKVDSLNFKQEADISLIEGSYSTQISEGINFRHQRMVLTLPEAITLICDDLTCKGEHQLQTQFILDDKVRVEKQRINDLRLISEVPFSEVATIISKKYNQLGSSKKIVKERSFKDSLFDYTLLVDKDCQVKTMPLIQTGSNKLVTDGFAWELRGEAYHYLVGILAKDILKGDKLYCIDQIKFRGKVVVYDYKENQFYRLKS